ncbi:MAG: hypothetical protein HFH89_07020 [Lachnospiraceae bacterium]|nr:hypothetical protein [uncultured Acetatifactor sp.]MCI8287391.1 hypothetical protein [Lachnospiraceae bacterium]
MDLLKKFESIEIRADTRITETDKAICEAHQSAYENAATALKELEYFWDDMLDQQKKLLASTDAAPTTYLLSHDSLKISDDAIHAQIRSLHSQFIRHLVFHFSSVYSFSISADDVETNLLPQKPPDRWTDNYKELAKKYVRDMQELTLHYNDILEQIFLQTGGRAFAEQALYELKNKCASGAWNISQKRADYIRKKCIIQFTRYACSFRSYYCANGSWELSDKMKNVLKGISHFETGSFSPVPSALAKLINGHYLNSSDYDFPDCQKVQSLKMFKNGRVDIKFSTEEHARKFMEEYLGTVCPCEA